MSQQPSSTDIEDSQANAANKIAENQSSSRAKDVIGGKLASERQEKEAELAVLASKTVTTVAAANTKEEFMSALSKCVADFAYLAKALGENVLSSVSQALGLPKMKKQFDSLSGLEKALLIIGLLAAFALLHWLSWKAIGTLWPKLMDFLKSDSGVKLLASATDALKFLNTCGIVPTFASLLSTAAADSTQSQTSENTSSAVVAKPEDGDDDDDETPSDTNVTSEIKEIYEKLKNNSPHLIFVEMFNSVFTYLAKQLIRK